MYNLLHIRQKQTEGKHGAVRGFRGKQKKSMIPTVSNVQAKNKTFPLN